MLRVGLVARSAGPGWVNAITGGQGARELVWPSLLPKGARGSHSLQGARPGRREEKGGPSCWRLHRRRNEKPLGFQSPLPTQTPSSYRLDEDTGLDPCLRACLCTGRLIPLPIIFTPMPGESDVCLGSHTELVAGSAHTLGPRILSSLLQATSGGPSHFLGSQTHVPEDLGSHPGSAAHSPVGS